MDIEQLAISAIVNVISRSDYLKADIHSGDKKLSWDGDIEVYKKPSTNHAKQDFYARVPVQVKGKSYKKTRKSNSLKYQVSIADLRNYLNDGGVIYFVVTLFENGENKAPVIFYEPLLPYDLKILLDKNSGKKKCSISLSPLPEDTDDVTRIIMNIANNMLKQRAAIISKPITLADIKSSNDIAKMVEEYSFSCIKWKDGSDVFDGLLYPKSPIYVYAHMKDGVHLPLAKFSNSDELEITVSEHITANISIDNCSYYKHFTLLHVRENGRRDEFHFGKSIKIVCTKSSEYEMQLNFTLRGTLSERITDTKFIIALLKEHYIEINNQRFSIGDVKDYNSDLCDSTQLEKLLEWLLNTEKILNYFGVSEDLDYDAITPKDEQNIQLLTTAVLEGKAVKLRNVHNVLNFIKIANLNICVYVRETEISSGKYYVGNFFDSDIQVKAMGESNNEYLVSYYTFFKRDFLLNCSNLNFSKMLADIMGIPMSKVYADRLVNLLLELFYAYDESKRQDILDAAIELAGYLKTEDTFTPIAVTKLNYYQAILRRRELEKNEIAELLELTEDKEQSEEIFTAAYLLLKNQIAAKIHFDKMSIDERQEFEKYPIYLFWQNR